MEILKISSSKNSPSVLIDMADDIVLKIKGHSIMENSEEFYQEIIEALDKLLVSEKEIIATIYFVYLNSASVKCILSVLNKIKLFNKSKIIWMYENDDEDMKERGKDFEEIIKIPFDFIEQNYEMGV
jgi:dihydroxyacetone kinase-like predicted kinase